MSDLTFEDFLQLAEEARGQGQFDEALDAYKKALMLLPSEDVLDRAFMYAAVADVKRQQGKPREAEANYEKALSAMPGYVPALRALVDIAAEEHDHRRVVERRQRLADRLLEPAEKAAELSLAAIVLDEKLSDSRAAINLFEKSRELSPGDVDVLKRLRTLYEKLSRWPKVVEIDGALCTEADDAAERGKLRFAQADITLGRLRDEVRGVSLLEAALEEDPTHEKAFHALVAVRTRRSEWQELERVYVRLIDRFAEKGDVDRAHEVCRRLAILRRDKLSDGPGAMEAFRGALQCRASDVDSRAALAELLIMKGETDTALTELERCALEAPTRAQTHRRLFETFQKNGMHDRAWLSAIALEELGVAEIDHQLILDQFKSEGAIKPTTKLDDDAWEKIRAPGSDPVIAAVLQAVCDSAVRAYIAEKKPGALDPFRKQDPKTSTISAVRGFVWAATVLGVATPFIYVLDDVPTGLAAVQVGQPTTAIGPSVLSGLSVAELAFVCGRHMTYYRPENYALVFYPTLPELTSLFLAALKCARPDSPVPGDKALAKLCKHFEKDLGDKKEALEDAVVRFEKTGGRVDLAAFIRSVELTAQRAGMLLLADPRIALTMVKKEKRAIADVKPDDRKNDLLAFLETSALAELRQRLTTSTSIRPPAQEATG